MDGLTQAEGALALRLARGAIVAALRHERPPAVDGLAQKRGAFVTLRADGELRGCIGATDARHPLRELIPDIAVSAAFEDPRFEPLGLHEVDSVRVEVSVLTPPKPVEGAILDAIEIGRHGLIAEAGRARGLLLPQVALEHAFDAATFASLTCRKAGLADDAWRTPGAVRWKTFESQVFEEG